MAEERSLGEVPERWMGARPGTWAPGDLELCGLDQRAQGCFWQPVPTTSWADCA